MISNRPPHPTAAAFFKALDGKNESRNQSELIRKRSQSLGWRNRHSQAAEYPVSIGDVDFSVEQVQRGEIEETYGTGATVWPASMVLLKYLEKNLDLIKNKSVIDLGAGTGVTSIAASLLGAKSIVCTDGCQNVVDLAANNIQKAPGLCDIRTERYWWGDDQYNDEQFDVILVSDCVLPKLYPIAPLVQALDDTMGDHSGAILSYEHRYFPEYHPKEKFIQLCAKKGLIVHTMPASRLDPVYSVEDIEIWHVERQS